MVIYKAKEGYEDFFELAKAKKEAFEADLEKAKTEAIARVEEEFAERKARIEKIFEEVADQEIIEDEPVVEEQSVEEQAEQQIEEMPL